MADRRATAQALRDSLSCGLFDGIDQNLQPTTIAKDQHRATHTRDTQPCRLLVGYCSPASAIACSLLHSANADSLTTTDGKTDYGELVSVDAQTVTFSTNESSQLKVPAKEIHLVDLGHQISPPPKDTKYHELELTDGSTFRIAKFAIKGKKFVTDLLPGPSGLAVPTYELALGAVFSVMRGAEDIKNRDAWKKILAGRGKRDLYVIREAEGLNFVSGTILGGNEAGDLLTFEKEDGRKAELKLSTGQPAGLCLPNHNQPRSHPPCARFSMCLAMS